MLIYSYYFITWSEIVKKKLCRMTKFLGKLIGNIIELTSVSLQNHQSLFADLVYPCRCHSQRPA
ncbi:hypothetical protein FOA39_00875 [Streptococcus cristatus]|nr:hypothetical protein [Streptococcus cristatus]